MFNKKEYLAHYLLGTLYRYPKCCIEQFANDAANGITYIAKRRVEKHKISWRDWQFSGVHYVMCDKCMKKYIERHNIK